MFSKLLFACTFFYKFVEIYIESYLFSIYHDFWNLKNPIFNGANDCYNKWNETESVDTKTNYSQRMICVPI